MIRPLTSFRFFAAMLVFLWHSNVFKQYQTGYIGVSFFFILSGFILTYSYHKKFISLKIHNLNNFYLARIAKIYPVHLLTFVLAIPLVLYEMGLQPKIIPIGVINLFLLQSYIPLPGSYFSFNGVSWSISDELFFYAFFPLVLLFFFKKNLTTSRVKLILFILVIFGGAALVIGSYHATINDWLVYIFPVVRMIDFLLGICLGFIFLRFSKEESFKTNNHLSTYLELVSLMILVMAILYSPHITQSLRYSLYYMPFFAFILLVFARQQGWISKILSFKIFVFLGEISFSFYMIHSLVLKYLVILDFHFVGWIGLIITLFMSSIVYMFYEEPLRKKIRYTAKLYFEKRNPSTDTLE